MMGFTYDAALSTSWFSFETQGTMLYTGSHIRDVLHAVERRITCESHMDYENDGLLQEIV